MNTDLVKERCRLVMTGNRITANSLAKANKVNQKTLHNQINGSGTMAVSTILLILQQIPTLSAEWLLRGTGDMYMAEDKGKPSGKPQEQTGKPQEQTGKPQEPKTYTGDTSDKDELINSLKARIAEQENYIADLRFMARLDKKQ